MTPPSFMHTAAAKQWERIGIRHHHGIAIPLFSLHSSKSCGIGEFTDLPLLIDWCASVGFDTIQLLPLNDTGEGTSPYSAMSAFALNPIYLGLSSLPYLEEHPELQASLKNLFPQSNTSSINYKLTHQQKFTFLHEYYEKVGLQITQSEEYVKFSEEASYWLNDYALFKTMQEGVHSDDFLWHCCLQFLCDKQCQAAKKYAETKHVFLMGDIPILIDRHSADVWKHQEIFNLHYAAGAPPDMFSEEGQNWGFPIYNWSVLEKNDYQWWRQRVHWVSRYFHLYRIDHVVGFFRIWAMSPDQKGTHGRFFPEDESIWKAHGEKIMRVLLESSSMLPIGEDLGVVPPQVRVCLKELGICGTRVMRWERKWHEDNAFIPTEEYLVESMTTVSTHDSETLYQWWEKYPSEAARVAESKGWEPTPLLTLEQHFNILKESHQSASLFHINPLQEYLALVPGLSWNDPNEERINIPGLVFEKNWTYRLKPSLEELLANTSMRTVIQDLL